MRIKRYTRVIALALLVLMLSGCNRGMVIPTEKPGADDSVSRTVFAMDTVMELSDRVYTAKEVAYTAPLMREAERVILLRNVDTKWMDHIDDMDQLRQGIALRSYGQHDPVIAYKEEGFEMFQAMITAIREETVRRMFMVQVRPQQEVKRERVAKETGTGAAVNAEVKKQPVRKEKKAGPNDPCPCGSGLKYKKCCMQKDK